MASLGYFTVVGTYLAATKDSVYDVDSNPELVPMSGAITFTPLFDSGDTIPAGTLTPPANVWMQPVRANLRGGVITVNGTPGVKLVANTSVLNLEGNLYYRVDFKDGLTAAGQTFHPDSFEFMAPSTSTTVDLVEVTPLPGKPAVGNVLPVLSVGGKTGAIILTADDINNASTVGKSLMTAADAAAARLALNAASTADLTSAVNGLIDGAPGTRDTLKEISDILTADEGAMSALTSVVAGKALMSVPTAVKTSAYTAVAGNLVPADASGGAFTVTLPASPPDGTPVVVKKIDTTSNPVTVQRSGLDVFNQAGGPSTLQLKIPDQTAWLQYKAGIWYVVGHGTPLVALDERFVDFATAQTLTNKTLTTPMIAIIADTNGNEGIQIDATASAVNFVRVQNSATGQAVTLRAAGDDADIGIQLRPKGTKAVSVLDSVGLLVAEFTTVASAVNYWRLTSSAASGPLTARAIGADTDIGINLIPKGAGKVQANGIEVVTLTDTQTLTNKTFTGPRVDLLKDTNGNTALLVDAVASAVNYLRVVNSITGAETLLRSAGADTDIAIGIRPKGAGSVSIRDGAGNLIVQYAATTTPVNRWQFASSNAGNAVTATASGTDTNIGINFVTKGTGRAQVGGVNVPTVSSVDTLTFKTLTAPIISGGSGTATISAGAGTPEGVVTATVGSLFLRTDGGAATSHYVKESGSGNTGWVAK